MSLNELTKDELKQGLVKAVNELLPYTERYIYEILPRATKFIFYANQAGVKFTSPLALDEAIEQLWHDGAVPNWVNLEVKEFDSDYTYILAERGEFTKDHTRFTQFPDIYPRANPFKICGPTLPPGWYEENPKFSLYWYKEGNRY